MENKDTIKKRSDTNPFVSYRILTKSTIVTPEVTFDISHGKLEIIGRSLPADSMSFYEPIIQNLRTYKGNELNVDISLEYFNTSSARCIYDMFIAIKRLMEKGVNICINWKTDPVDKDMKEMGKDFSQLTGIPFQFEFVE